MLEQTVTAIAEASLAEQLGAPPDGALSADIGALLLRKLRGMPRFLGSGMMGVTLMVGLAPIPTHGRPFHRLPMDERQARLRALKTAPVGVLRDFVLFYEKMGTFAYYCHVEEQEGHGHGHPQGSAP